MILPLTKHSNSVWKQKLSNIPKLTPEIKKLVSDMKETLELTSAVGLAAPQVAKPLRLFIVDYGKLKEAFINPKIIRYGKEADKVEEGCLSVPGVRGTVSRPKEIEIEYVDVKGRKKKVLLTGYYARIVQHEYDHLSSIFYTNRIIDKKKLSTYKPIKIVYFGTPKFGATILRTIYGQQLVGEYAIALVVTSSDKPSGRGQLSVPSEVKQLANGFNLPVATPNSLKNNRGLISKLKSLDPDFLVLASYSKIIPKEILSIPKKGAVNIHPSLLPKYRGPSPVQAAILNGETRTGITIMKMVEKVDVGGILASARLRISSKDTAVSLSDKLATLASKLILHVLHLAYHNKIKSKPQNHKKAIYTKMLLKEDGYINWKKPPKNLERMIRAYYPWPGVWTRYNGKILKLLPESMVQLEGKKPISLKEFQAGHADFTLKKKLPGRHE
jgi:methionyl-tRNA formyltransferase